jgi:hypothetical protein
MRQRPWITLLATLALACSGLADTLKLLDGKVVQGTFLGGDARTIRMEVNNKIELFPIAGVESLTFGGGLMAAAPPEKLDPKKAKEDEKARKKAAEEAEKAAKEAEKAQQAAAKAAAKAEEAAAKAQGVAGNPTQAAAPKAGRFGKAPSVKAPAMNAPAVQAPPPPVAGTAGELANAATAAPGAVGNAAQTASNVASSANQAAATAQQAASIAADPASAAVSTAQNAAVGAASSVAGAAAPALSTAQQAASTTQTVQGAARTATAAASSTRASSAPSAPADAGRTAASPSSSPASASPAPAGPVASSAPAVSPAAPASVSAQAPESAEQEAAAVANGTIFRVRLIENINSAIHKPGEIFRASLENPLVSGGATVPKGADVMVRLVELPARGAARPLLTLEAISLRVDYRNLPFSAEAITQPGDALRSPAGGSGVQPFNGAELIQVPADGLVSFRTARNNGRR